MVDLRAESKWHRELSARRDGGGDGGCLVD
jgi:hypothetical protein